MALPETHLPQAVAQVNNYLTSLCSSLSQSLLLARRCAEGFRSKYQQFLDIRKKVDDYFSYLQEILIFNDFNKYADSVNCSIQLTEDLSLDTEIVHELCTIFNEYLSYIIKIRQDLDNAQPKSEAIVKLAKSELPEFFQTLGLIQSTTGDIELIQIIPILKHMDLLSTGKIEVLHQMLEHLTYISCHWDIIENLNQLESHKDYANDVIMYGADIFSESNADDKSVLEKRVCYHDLLHNLSVSSTAKAYISMVLSLTKEEIEGKVEDISAKLMKIQRAMIYATQRIGMVTELLISET